jgi:hypothetical protein
MEANIKTILDRIELTRTEIKMCHTTKTIALGDGDDRIAARCSARIAGLKLTESCLLEDLAAARRAAR